MSSIKVTLSSADYEAVLTITKSFSLGPFDSDWTCDPEDAFSESSGKAANLMGSDDLSILGSGGQTFGKLLLFSGKSSGHGEKYDDGRLPEKFDWSK
ncbi:hypothetical protein [Burkholderia ambifaria]|uniref:hypothetical protein n=1 Tax=Burkholderia ambifaria TaxID=152480 RepID=UPI001588A4D2|nr:hypothetical protein [Burkholderia ambifaria]